MTHLYERLAELCEYPTGSLHALAEACAADAPTHDPRAASLLSDFAAAVAALDSSELEELYARTFDMNPARCLDLGYQIFGESYKRGLFLVKMKEAVRAHGVDSGLELADHLPVVLRLLVRLDAGEHADELVAEVVLPSIEKVLRTFDASDDTYRLVLAAVERVLMADFAIDHVEPAPDDPATARAATDGRGRRLPMFPGFDPPSQRPSP